MSDLTPRPPRVLTSADTWEKIHLAYVHGKDYADLSAEYGVKASTIRQRVKRYKLSHDRRAVSQAVAEQVVQGIIEEKVSHLEKFNADDLRMARAIRAKAAGLMAMELTPQDLRALAGAVDLAQKVGRLALGAEIEITTINSRDGSNVPMTREALMVELVARGLPLAVFRA